jgi:signal transduction histidine kinase/ligand-binding sensor domain-containing protein
MIWLRPQWSALVLACLLLPGLRSQAQSDFYARLWQTENGLPNNIVQAVAQTRDGYIWVGTREGLARFDGEQFSFFYLLPKDIEPSINCLLGSSDGSLWIGTDGRGVFRLGQGGLQQFELPGSKTDYSTFKICESSDGSVWFETGGGVLCWRQNRLELVKALGSGHKNICSDAQGGIWVLDRNLIRADLPTPTNYFSKAGLLPRLGRILYRDSQGCFWIGADSSGGNDLIKVEGSTISRYATQKGPAGFPRMLLRDSSGELWVGSYEGLTRLVNGKFVPFESMDGSLASLTSKVYCMFEDREQNLWVGSYGGLTRLTPMRFKTITRKEGLPSNTALAVCSSRDGGVWISSWGSGLSHYVDGKITVLNTTNGLPSDYVMAVAESRDGSLWVGTDYGGPLLQIRENVVSAFDAAKGYAISHGVPALYEDEKGLLWIGTRDSLQTWDGTEFKKYTTRHGLSDIEVDALCGGAEGSVWIGAVGGLSRWKDGKFEDWGAHNPALHVFVLSLFNDAENTLWIGTKGKGVLRLRDGVVTEFNHQHGLVSDSIYAILEDRHTNLWFNSSRGIFRVDKRQMEAVADKKQAAFTSIRYGVSDGILASSQYIDSTQPAACKDRQGRMWFRTTLGVAMVDPEKAVINGQPPPIVLQSVIAHNKPIALGDFGGASPVSITVPPGNGLLEIRFAALSYRESEKNLYRYKLEGVDTDWIDAQNHRSARYNNLAPNSYRFRVIACNNDGVWNNEGASLEIVLEPHFWQTYWFSSGMVVLAVVAVGGTARYITRRRMQRKLNELEKRHAVEQERARIARDVHDELGAKLTTISYQGSIAQCSLNDPVEIQKQLEQMAASARKAVSSLHEIVWAVDPANDSLEGLVALIGQQVGELFASTPVQCEVIEPENIPALHLSAGLRHNLFLAVMEAANNAAKHSRASKVVIKVVFQADGLEIEVSDNGAGFQVDLEGSPSGNGARLSGNGLMNMRRRMKTIGGFFDVSSKPGLGTTLRFRVSLKTG